MKAIGKKALLSSTVREYGDMIYGIWSCDRCNFWIFPRKLKEKSEEFEWRGGRAVCPACKINLRYEEAQ